MGPLSIITANLKQYSKDVYCGLFLFVACLLWLMPFLREPNYVDDASYFEFASQVFNGRTHPPSGANLFRMGLIYPAVASIWMFGYTPEAYYAVSFTFSALLTVATYVLARQFIEIIPSFFVAILVAASPFYLEYATILRIDVPSLFWYLLGLALFVYALRPGRKTSIRVWVAVAAGFCFFLTWWTKEGMVALLASLTFVPFFLERDRLTWKLLFLTGGLGVLLIALEFLGYYFLYGDVLARINGIRGGHLHSSRTEWVSLGLVGGELSWWKLLARYPIKYLDSMYGRVVLGMVAFTTLLALILRKRPMLMFVLLGSIMFLFISLMVSRTDPLVPLMRTKDRYFLVCFVLFSFAYVFVTWSLFKTFISDNLKQRPIIRNSLLILFCGGVYLYPSYLGASGQITNWYHVRRGANAMHQVRSLVTYDLPKRGLEVKRILSGSRTLRVIRMYVPVEYHDRLQRLDYGAGKDFDFQMVSDFRPGDLVVLNMSRLTNNEKYFYTNKLPDFIKNPPGSWELQASTKWRTFRIYYVTDQAGGAGSTLTGSKLDLRHMHAYAYKKEFSKKFKVDASEEKLNLVISEASDYRIVLGKGKYHKYPYVTGAEDLLGLKQGDRINFRVHVKRSPAIEFPRAYLVLFEDKTTKPTMVKISTELVDNEGYLRALYSCGSDCPYTAFRVMLQAEGAGTITFSDLAVDKGSS